MEEGIKVVVFVYGDASTIYFHSTLNEDILMEYGVFEIEDGCYYNIDQDQMYKIPEDVQVFIIDKEEDLGEVNTFAHKFI